MASVDELRQMLTEDSNGQNLYDHLTQILMRILVDKPKNAYESFELLSAETKKQPLKPHPSKIVPLPQDATQLQKQLDFVAAASKLFKAPDEAPEDNGVKVPDLMDDASLYQWAGVHLGKGDAYRLFLSIKKLALELPSEVERVRFVGLFRTNTLPYYVVEGLEPEELEVNDAAAMEGKDGVNKFAYWVTQDLVNGKWVKLPHVECRDLVVARSIRTLLTGNLETHVRSFPPFCKNEAAYLRARLALLVGETSISPDGFFDVDSEAEPPVVIPADAEAMNERFPKTAEELKDVENWRHHELPPNVLGRTLVLPEVLDENGDPITPEEEIEVATPLDAVKPEEWCIRPAPSGAGFSDSSVVVARSVRWPGAVAIATNRKFVNVYVGNGLSYAPTPTQLPLPRPMQREWLNIAEDEEEIPADANSILLEQADALIDPTPPKEEEEEVED